MAGSFAKSCAHIKLAVPRMCLTHIAFEIGKRRKQLN